MYEAIVDFSISEDNLEKLEYNQIDEWDSIGHMTLMSELEGAFNRIVAHASLVGTTITVEMARETLADLIRASSRRVTVDDIQKQVSKHFSIRTSEMFSARRARSIARPRQIAMYLA